MNGIAVRVRRCKTAPMPERLRAACLERLVRALLIAFAALLLAAPATAAPNRIVAVGDLHGDYAAWLDIARNAGVIDARGHWAGGRTTLVQLGDVVDREPNSLQIIRSLQQLQKEAPHAGGKVVVILGNHEAMNLLGDYRYTTPGEFAAFADKDSPARRDRVYDVNRARIEAAYRSKDPSLTPEQIRQAWNAATPLGWVEHKLAWSPSGELGRWASQNPAVVKINGTLFVHGGISAAFAAVPSGEINRRVTEALKARDSSPTAIINDPHGPLWYRGLVTRVGSDETTVAPAPAPAAAPTLTMDQEIDLVLRGQGVKRIVVAHTPSLAGIVSASGGRLWRVDSGNSRIYGGIPSYLEIVGDRVTAHPVPRTTGSTWGPGR